MTANAKEISMTIENICGKRAMKKFEIRLLEEYPGLIDVYLGTRNGMNNSNENIIWWERDNLEFNMEIGFSRFFLISAIRSI